MYRLIRDRLFAQDAETAHDFVSKQLKLIGSLPLIPRLLREFHTVSSRRLSQELFGLTFENPIGLAAGMDKTGERLRGWQMFGFGFLDAGGFTLRPQEGNPQPRLFRLVKDRAIINRMGFNNPGAEQGAQNLAKVKPYLKVPLLINMGKGKDTELKDAPKEYADILECLWPFGDAFVINVSSPNTLGLRALQQKEHLEEVIDTVQKRVNRCPLRPKQGPKALLIKIAPDLTESELDDMLSVIEARRVAGIIATNTTVGREGLSEPTEEKGGLSGPPLFPKALSKVRYIHARLPRLPIIASGGIGNFDTAWQMYCAGASLQQIYTGLVYEGPGIVREINDGLSHRLASMDKTITELT